MNNIDVLKRLIKHAQQGLIGTQPFQPAKMAPIAPIKATPAPTPNPMMQAAGSMIRSKLAPVAQTVAPLAPVAKAVWNGIRPALPFGSSKGAPAAPAAPATRSAPTTSAERATMNPEQIQQAHLAWTQSPEYKQQLARNYTMNNIAVPTELQQYAGSATAAMNKTPAQAATAASPTMATTAAIEAPAATPPLAGKPG